jgi:predicted  nucleic acid-binding Zn-ribbon protein
MKHLPFKIIILCILLPPLLYMATVSALERYFTGHYEKAVNNVYLSEMDAVLAGSVHLSDAINDSVSSYIDSNRLIRMGVKVDVTVATNRGTILYPPVFQDEIDESMGSDPTKIAQQNFQMLDKGLSLEVEATIEPLSIFSGAVLMIYILLFGGGLYANYRMAVARIRREDREKADELERLHNLETEYARQVDKLDAERRSLMNEYTELKQSLDVQRREAEQNEEDMFEEIEDLEKRLSQNLSEQQQQQDEISRLQQQLQDLEKLRENVDRQKEKEAERLGKRFKALYKQVEMYDRALRGMTELTEDMALKAEEVIHQLNNDSSMVAVKRKVFNKKGKATVFEVVFAYNGRLYFSKNEANHIHIMAVGTKNTQNRDLAYVDRMAS